MTKAIDLSVFGTAVTDKRLYKTSQNRFTSAWSLVTNFPSQIGVPVIRTQV